MDYINFHIIAKNMLLSNQIAGLKETITVLDFFT